MPAVTNFALRLLHTKTGAVVATTAVHAESADSAYTQGMRVLTRNACSWAFWELEEFPRPPNPAH
jgi:hypothetical protein